MRYRKNSHNFNACWMHLECFVYTQLTLKKKKKHLQWTMRPYGSLSTNVHIIAIISLWWMMDGSYLCFPGRKNYNSKGFHIISDHVHGSERTFPIKLSVLIGQGSCFLGDSVYAIEGVNCGSACPLKSCENIMIWKPGIACRYKMYS